MLQSFLHILLLSMALVACYRGERSDRSPTTVDDSSASEAAEQSTPALEPLAEATPTMMVPLVRVETDRQRYKLGESIIITVENNEAEAIRFNALCSLHLCLRSGQEWICVERECDGEMTIIQPGGSLELPMDATSTGLDPGGDNTYRYKLDYQIVSEEPFYFSQSKEFVVENE